MKIETKIPVEEVAYFLFENKVYKGIVKCIHIYITRKQTNILYTVEFWLDSDSGNVQEEFTEARVFPTKEELLASL